MEINYKRLLNLLEKKDFQKADVNFNDEHLAFVLGNTMAGKSTMVNYFLDNIEPCQNKKTMNSYYERIDSNVGPDIGHSLGASKTKCVTTHKFQHNNLKFYLCDFPGFLNSEQLEESIVLALGVQYLVKTFKSFHSIFIVISEDDFSSSRASCFKELLQILNGLFSDIDSIKDSFFFLFNKSKNGKSFELCEELSQHLPNDKILDLITSNRDKCEIMNLKDANSKNKILNYLSKQNKALSTDLLNFNNYDKCLSSFNKELEKKVKEINELFEQQLSLSQAVVGCVNTIEKLNEQKKQANAQKEQLKRNLKLNMSNEEFTRQDISIDESIKNFKEYQTEKKNNLSDLEAQLKAENEKLSELDNQDQVELKYDEIDQKGSCFGMVKWSKKKFNYNEIDMPFTNAVVKYNRQDGKLKIKENNGQMGKFSAVYKSYWDKPAKAELVLFIESQYYNQRQIKKIKSVIAKKEKERTSFLNNLNEYEQKINEQYEKRADLHDRKSKLEEMNADLINLDKETLTIEKDISHQILGKADKVEFIKAVRGNIKSQNSVIECINFLLEYFPNSYMNEHFQLFRTLLVKINENIDIDLV